MKNVSTALSQIEWQRYHEGSYYGNDPLLVTQSKLRDIQSGKESKLDQSDYSLLLNATDTSIRKLCNYDYGPNVDAEGLRQFALQPLFNLRTELMDLMGGL